MKRHMIFRKAVVCFFWLAIWQLTSTAIHNTIIFVGPLNVLEALLRLAKTMEFWDSVFHSLGRILAGFLAAFFTGIAIGSLSFRFSLIKEFLNPLIVLMKAIPVASFVILALIWVGSANLAIFISFLVVLPMIYINIISGLESTDTKMLEMAQVFRIGLWKRIRFLYIPAVRPYLVSGCEIALGMAWKSGIAAEVIGIPTHSIGEGLYLSKIYLETGDVFAWTSIAILVCAACEKLFSRLLRWEGTGQEKKIFAAATAAKHSVRQKTYYPAHAYCLDIRSISKSYHGVTIFHNDTFHFHFGEICCLMGASGRGKTTLLRIILGLEPPDAGEIAFFRDPPSRLSSAPPHFSVVFQENRLCESLSPLNNVALTAAAWYSQNQLKEELLRLLPEESIFRPTNTLSGGMKRRVAIVRALLAPSQIILMDEPFTGLDELTRHSVIRYILEKRQNRLLLITTHQEEDVALLNATLIRL